MKAEETVMKDRELLTFEIKYSRDDTFYWGAAFDAALKAQAEISFKAGIQEVVEWLEEHSAIGYGDYTEERCQLYQEWQAKLKEWEIE